jgi:hypothetical protein
MSNFMKRQKLLTILFAILFLGTGVLVGCGEDEDVGMQGGVAEDEQFAEETGVEEAPEMAQEGQEELGMEEAPQVAQEQTQQGQTQVGAAAEQEKPLEQTRAYEKLVGMEVMSSDGEMLGTVADLERTGQDRGHVFVRTQDNRLHPVPADLLEEAEQGRQLRASFDRSAFEESPSYSEEEQQQITDSQLEQVRGYYENLDQQGQGQKPQG